MLKETELKDYKLPYGPLIYVCPTLHGYEKKEDSSDYNFFQYLQPVQVQHAILSKTLVYTSKSIVKIYENDKAENTICDLVCETVSVQVTKRKTIPLTFKFTVPIPRNKLNGSNTENVLRENIYGVRFTNQTQVYLCESISRDSNQCFQAHCSPHHINSIILQPIPYHIEFDKLFLSLQQHNSTLPLLYGLFDQYFQHIHTHSSSSSSSSSSLFHSKVLLSGRSGNGCATLIHTILRQQYPTQPVVCIQISGLEIIQYGKDHALDRLKAFIQQSISQTQTMHSLLPTAGCILVIEDLHTLTPVITTNLSIEQIDFYHIFLQGMIEVLNNNMQSVSMVPMMLIGVTYNESLLSSTFVQDMFPYKLVLSEQKLTYTQQRLVIPQIIHSVYPMNRYEEDDEEGERGVCNKIQHQFQCYQKAASAGKEVVEEEWFVFSLLRTLFYPYSVQLRIATTTTANNNNANTGSSSSSSSAIITSNNNNKFYDFQAFAKLFEQQILWPRQYSIYYERLNYHHKQQSTTHMLFYGPTGCGKSTLPSYLAQVYHYAYLPIQLTDLIQGEIGSSEKRIIQLFQEAKRKAPCLVFIDEFDCLFANDQDHDKGQQNTVISTLLHAIDEITAWSQYASTTISSPATSSSSSAAAFTLGQEGNHQVLVIVASREPWCIDSRFLQANRISERVCLTVLSSSGRQEMISDCLMTLIHELILPLTTKDNDGVILYLPPPMMTMLMKEYDVNPTHENRLYEELIQELVNATEGFSGAEIKFAFQKVYRSVVNAVGMVLSEKKNNGASCQRVINVWDDCIVEVFKSMKSLLTNDHLLSFANWQKETKKF